jgi:O-acetyl-ADP-ribose deacetylase (regulator of RNase III)
MLAYERYAEKPNQEFGKAVITKSGGGNSNYLIHTVTVGSGANEEFSTVQRAMLAALKLAEAKKLETIAVPALGTGIIGQLTDVQSAQALMSAIHEYQQQGGSPLKVTFVIFRNPQAISAFENTLKDKSYLQVDRRQIGVREFSLDRWMASMLDDGQQNSEAARRQADDAQLN